MPSPPRFPSMLSALRFLRDQVGVEIGTVIDVGVQHRTDALLLVYPDKRHLLFEPLAEFKGLIAESYQAVAHELTTMAVSDYDGLQELELQRRPGGGDVWLSRIHRGSSRPLVRVVPTVRLDTFLAGRDEAKPYLLKIGTGGHELEVLGGAAETFGDTAILLLKVTLSDWAVRMNAAIAAGFALVDVVDLVYDRGALREAALVFVRSDLLQGYPGLLVSEASPDWFERDEFSHLEGNLIRPIGER